MTPDTKGTAYEGLERSDYSRMLVTAMHDDGLEVIMIAEDEETANQIIENCSKLKCYQNCHLGYVGYRVWRIADET